MEYLPISLRVKDRVALVVGGGQVAARKAALLARAGARVRVVAPEQVATFTQLTQGGHHSLERRTYHCTDLGDCVVAVAASDDPEVNAQVALDACAAGVPVNVVDDPSRSTFVMPSVIDRDPLLVAVSTAGAAPVLARTLRARLDALLPARLGELAALMGRYREPVKQAFATVVERRAFWEQLLDGPVAELVGQGRLARAERQLQRALAAGLEGLGAVYLVGVGSGDPDDLTFRAQRALQSAEQLWHAASVPEAILERARRDAPRHPVPEPVEVEAMAEPLIEAAARGERVCWLCLGGLGAREQALEARLQDASLAVVRVAGLPVDDGAAPGEA